MVFWGFVMWFVGGVAGLLALLSNLMTTSITDIGIIDNLEVYGIGGYLGRLFDMQYLSAKKIVFFVAILLIVVGLVVFFLGRAKVRRTGEPEKAGARAMKYWRDTKGEYKKIAWPSFKTVVKNTGVTLAVCAIAAIFICLVDIGLSSLIDLLLSL